MTWSEICAFVETLVPGQKTIMQMREGDQHIRDTAFLWIMLELKMITASEFQTTLIRSIILTWSFPSESNTVEFTIGPNWNARRFIGWLAYAIQSIWVVTEHSFDV